MLPGTSVSLAYGSGLSKPPSIVAADAAGTCFSLWRDVLRLDATTGMLTLGGGKRNAGFSGDTARPQRQLNLHQPCGGLGGQPYIMDSGNTFRRSRTGFYRGGNGSQSQRRQRPRYHAGTGNPTASLWLCRHLYNRASGNSIAKFGRVHHTRPGAGGTLGDVARHAPVDVCLRCGRGRHGNLYIAG